MNTVIAALHILLVLVLVLVREIPSKTEDVDEEEGEEDGPSSAFSTPVNNGVKLRPGQSTLAKEVASPARQWHYVAIVKTIFAKL